MVLMVEMEVSKYWSFEMSNKQTETIIDTRCECFVYQRMVEGTLCSAPGFMLCLKVIYLRST